MRKKLVCNCTLPWLSANSTVIRQQLSPILNSSAVPNMIFFYQLTQASGIPCCVQQGEDLGERMCHAFVDRLLVYSYVIIIGSDCPSIDGRYVAQALGILNKGVPAEQMEGML
ncbi:MAG: DUF2064 domain-containing protein [Porticoccus sp.]|nr:DUF2064 domain-containing protein [Porticoccus sp.]